MIPWYVKDPSLLASIENEIENNFSGLRVLNIENKIFINGRFDVYYDNSFYDRYGIKVELADNHPIDMPRVFETENRLSKTLNRHFNADESACLFVPFERLLYWPDSRSISQFLGGPVNSYFYSQSFYTNNGRYPFGDRSHDLAGILESVQELCGVSTNNQALAIIKLLSQNDIKGHWACPCGSNEKIKNCHGTKIFKLQKMITPKQLLRINERILFHKNREAQIKQRLLNS